MGNELRETRVIIAAGRFTTIRRIRNRRLNRYFVRKTPPPELDRSERFANVLHARGFRIENIVPTITRTDTRNANIEIRPAAYTRIRLFISCPVRDRNSSPVRLPENRNAFRRATDSTTGGPYPRWVVNQYRPVKSPFRFLFRQDAALFY